MEPLVISGRYEVIRRLAIGGMGEIFLARQTGIAGFKRLAILKTLRPELSEREGFLDQFLDEGRLAASLNHPNIVAVYEVGLHEEMHFIAMEYIGGVDLAALVREAGKRKLPVPHRVAAAVVAAAASGLDYAHFARDESGKSLHVVHRDVSPHNLMIRPDGLVKVVDFGVAQATDQLHETSTDRIKGKVRYMAPEQLSGEVVDGRSDEFSLGIVLWELLAGRPLFSQSNPVEVFQRILTGDLPKLRDHAPNAPDALVAICARMMATQKEQRYPRLSDVAQVLRAYLATGGDGSEDVAAFVTSIAGDQIEARVRDLTPRPTSMTASASRPVVPADALDPLDTGAPTRVMKTDPPRPASGEGTADSSEAKTDALNILDKSDALLSAMEHSGVLHGARRLLVVLAGQLSGWEKQAARIANVPMGAFALSRLKNLLLRQLERVARDHGGSVIAKSTERVLIAFGVEEPRPDDGLQAVRCGNAIHALMVELSKEEPLVAHIGIAGGLCMVEHEGLQQLKVGGAPVEAAELLATQAQEAGEKLVIATGVAQMVEDAVALRAISDGSYAIDVSGEAGEGTGSREIQRRILIADDADVVRRIVEEILRPHGYAFLHAKDGGQAVKLAVEQKPDLVILDIQMPVMDGVQVLAYLKKNPDTLHIPVVIITTIGREHDEQLLMQGGAAAFLKKPVAPATLVGAVKRALASR